MRDVFITTTFKGRLTKFLAYHPDLKKAVSKTLKMLRSDMHTPSLQTHRLHGKMKNSYACSINYKYRIVFTFDDNLIYPDSIGDHDDVY